MFPQTRWFHSLFKGTFYVTVANFIQQLKIVLRLQDLLERKKIIEKEN